MGNCNEKTKAKAYADTVTYKSSTHFEFCQAISTDFIVLFQNFFDHTRAGLAKKASWWIVMRSPGHTAKQVVSRCTWRIQGSQGSFGQNQAQACWSAPGTGMVRLYSGYSKASSLDLRLRQLTYPAQCRGYITVIDLRHTEFQIVCPWNKFLPGIWTGTRTSWSINPLH